MQHVFLRQDPPAPRRETRPRRDWDDVARRIRNQPGEWFLVMTDANPAHAHHLRSGRTGEFSDPALWDVIDRNRSIYIRYTGPSEADYWTSTD